MKNKHRIANILILVLIAFLILGCISKPETSQNVTEEKTIQEEATTPQESTEPIENKALPAKEEKKETQANTDIINADIIQGYTHKCERRMGFDNYRTFHSLVVDPNNSDILYVAVEYKGIYKSIDRGKTWLKKNKGLRGYPKENNPKEPCIDQHPLIVIDPTNSQRILITTATSPGTLKDMNSEGGGVYESLDGGESWRQIFDENMNAWTYDALVLDPTDTKTAYVGTTSMPASYDEADPNKIFVTEGIVYKTEDGGKNWKELPTGIVPNLRAGKLFINPGNPKNLIFTTFAIPPNKGGGQISKQQVGILETTDGGETWKKLESLPEDSRAIREADIAPQNFNNIFLSVAISNEEEARYYSLDGGKSFHKTDTQVNIFSYNPNDPKGMHMIGFSVYAQPNDIFESLDGGKTWKPYGKLPSEVTNELRVSSIVWDPNNKDVVYLNGDEGHVWRSVDGGKTWELLSVEKLK